MKKDETFNIILKEYEKGVRDGREKSRIQESSRGSVLNKRGSDKDQQGGRPYPDRGSGKRGQGKVIAKGISTDQINDGRLSFIGAKIENAAQLASLMQNYRNPLYETFRVFYMKDEHIVCCEAISNHSPGSVVIGNIQREINKKCNKLNADGFYLLHNHPSGDPTPTDADILATVRLAMLTDNLLGHIVIDHTTFAHIDGLAEVEYGVVNNAMPKDIFLTASIEHPLLGRSVTNGEDLAGVGRRILDSDKSDLCAIIYPNAKGRIRGIEEISSSIVKDDEAFRKFVKEGLLSYGSVGSFLVTSDEKIYGSLDNLIKDKYFFDVLFIEYDYNMFWSRAENDILPDEHIEFAGQTWEELKTYTQVQVLEEYAHILDDEEIEI